MAESANTLGTALWRAIFAIREKKELAEGVIHYEDFQELLTSELKLEANLVDMIEQRINFGEGELKTDDLLARLELIRTEVEEKEHFDPIKEVATSELNDNILHLEPMLANGSYGSVESTMNPWKRTVSHLSLGLVAEEGDISKVHVEVSVVGKVGPFYDRHFSYAVSIPDQNKTVERRYKDFEWLREVLLLKYPFRAIPPIPSKAFFNGSDEFISSRRRGLEEFIYLVSNHPIIQKDEMVAEFLSVGDLSALRTTLQSPWQEEFARNTDTPGATVVFKESTSLQFDDAKRWCQQVKDIIDDLRKTLLELGENQHSSAILFARLSTFFSTILENTQHSTTNAAAIADSLSKIDESYRKMENSMASTSIRLEVFAKLIKGCMEMIDRTQRMKYNRFDWLSKQIVNAQAHAEKLRVRDEASVSPDLERALSRVSQLQQELSYNTKRNDFADRCLEQELGWVVRMTKSLPLVLESFSHELSQDYQYAADITRGNA